MSKFILALLATLPLACAAEVYKWTDEQGRVHFGDQPQDKEKAERLSLKVKPYESVSYESVAPAKSQRVVMYAASWCGYCRQARNYFRQSGIAYVEYDIEKNQSARKAYDAIGGNGVPVILFGDKRLNGFSIDSFRAIYP